MRCYICNVNLTEAEISLDKELKSNPCTTCQDIIYETAFSGGFVIDDDKFAEMIENELDNSVEL